MSPKQTSNARVNEVLENSSSEELKALRRKLNNHILKNQYSFWAGMYVKRLPNQGNTTIAGTRPSAEEILQKKR
jgi:hypothetical protein